MIEKASNSDDAPIDARQLFWLAAPMALLRQARNSGRFPHAILVNAAVGCGGEALCRYIAQAALCRQQQAPCGQCRECALAGDMRHADTQWVTMEEKKTQISVEQIRTLGEKLTMSSYESGASVAVIAPADRLNVHSANSLLKTLEEPRAGVCIVLLTAWPGRLLATIRSRCLMLRVAPPPVAAAIAWLNQQSPSRDWPDVLALCGGAPLAALAGEAATMAACHRNTVEIMNALAIGRLVPPGPALEWSRNEQYAWRIASIENWITRRVDALIQVSPPLHLPAPALALKIAAWSKLLDSTHELLRQMDGPLNKSLALERLFWQTSRVESAAAA